MDQAERQEGMGEGRRERAAGVRIESQRRRVGEMGLQGRSFSSREEHFVIRLKFQNIIFVCSLQYITLMIDIHKCTPHFI